VAGSVTVCLDLVEFALEQNLTMGVLYCSLENKHTGQIYQQNSQRVFSEPVYFSQKDYFLKSAKVFGEDIPAVKAIFDSQGYTGYRLDLEQDLLEFNPKRVKLLKSLDVEIGISTAVHEIRDGESVVRELKLDITTPKRFTLSEV